MYYYPRPTTYYNYNAPNTNYRNNRLVPGGFILPFALGFATAPLVLPPFYNRPRPPYYGPRPPYYGPVYY